MNDKIAKLKNCEFMKILQKVLSSKYFPFLTAAFTLLSYYLGLDVVLFYYIAIVGIAMIILLDDVTPIISILIFIGVAISLKNTPSVSMGNSDYYHRPEIFIQIFIIVGLMIAAAIYRFVKTVLTKKFKLTQMFFGLCAFAFVLIINGIFSKDYDPKNLLFGVILAVFFLGIYSALKDNLKITANSYDNIAYSFLALSVLLVIELIVAYATTEGIFENGTIDRGKLIFGWGVYNTFGLMLLMCIPAVMYLACKKQYGFVYTLYSFSLFVALFFSCSRQAMVGGIIIYPFCLVLLFLKGKNRFANMCVLGAAAVAGIILIGIFNEAVFNFFKVIFDNIIVNGELNGSGRTRLWREAAAYFKKYPIFGAGFFVDFTYTGDSGLGFIPLMCHNTVLQLLSACGILGLAVYTVHRTQTIISYFKNINAERTFIALTILSILILSLLDNHIFNVFPTIIYSALIAVLDKSEKVKL